MVDTDEAIQIAMRFLARRLAERQDLREPPRVQGVSVEQVMTVTGARPCHIVNFGWPLRVAVDQETGDADMLR
ncbi:hypothetical protein DDE19_04120 [Micromonospora ureilytica]|uniref:Uncharacterized protein n=1 Tax=Micromonospora ureilytica TaxID=709868 RepID=A0A3N9Y3A3_9ACTN|nr:hypothetical protein [Micromonospora ureilytica]RQX19434.1 hypothetical protein DDE19_04120 [Micromonospora ureilytica]